MKRWKIFPKSISWTVVRMSALNEKKGQKETSAGKFASAIRFVYSFNQKMELYLARIYKTGIGPVSWQQQTTKNCFGFYLSICSSLPNFQTADYIGIRNGYEKVCLMLRNACCCVKNNFLACRLSAECC